MTQTFLFYFFSAVCVLSSLGVILHPKPTRALLLLILTMLGLSGLFTLLGAYFLAMAQIVVYAGAVLVVFLFVIMLQGVNATELPLHQRFRGIYLIPAGALAASLAAFFALFISKMQLPALQIPLGTVENFGRKLFQSYLLPFEWASLLILLGVFAAVALAKKDPS